MTAGIHVYKSVRPWWRRPWQAEWDGDPQCPRAPTAFTCSGAWRRARREWFDASRYHAFYEVLTKAERSAVPRSERRSVARHARLLRSLSRPPHGQAVR